MRLTKAQGDKIMEVIRRTESDHYMESSECDLCGSHMYCSCGESYTDHGHIADMIVEALYAEFEVEG